MKKKARGLYSRAKHWRGEEFGPWLGVTGSSTRLGWDKRQFQKASRPLNVTIFHNLCQWHQKEQLIQEDFLSKKRGSFIHFSKWIDSMASGIAWLQAWLYLGVGIIIIIFFNDLFLFYFFATLMWDLSSLTRDWTLTPCIGRWIPNHWTTWEVPGVGIISSRLILLFLSSFLSSSSSVSSGPSVLASLSGSPFHKVVWATPYL